MLGIKGTATNKADTISVFTEISPAGKQTINKTMTSKIGALMEIKTRVQGPKPD